jgi:hypothetical protein
MLRVVSDGAERGNILRVTHNQNCGLVLVNMNERRGSYCWRDLDRRADDNGCLENECMSSRVERRKCERGSSCILKVEKSDSMRSCSPLYFGVCLQVSI